MKWQGKYDNREGESEVKSMREVFRKIKAFYIQKKKLAVGVTVAILGVLTAVGVYAMTYIWWKTFRGRRKMV